MRYSDVQKAVFLSRPNRFIAHCLLEGVQVIAHVPNTGRCAELLIPGVSVYLQHHVSGNRKTDYTLIAVQHDQRIINIDSQAPNQLFADYLRDGGLLPHMTERISLLQREQKFQQSRFDLYFEYADKKCYAEVKGVTLQEGAFAVFPDAPTVRGLKHIRELIHAAQQGFQTYLLFAIQLQGVQGLRPNWITQPAFGNAMRQAAEQGVHLAAYECTVEADRLEVFQPIAILLS